MGRHYWLIISQSHQAFRHSVASTISPFRQLRVVVRSFFALLKTLSHSVDIVGIVRVSKSQLTKRRIAIRVVKMPAEEIRDNCLPPTFPGYLLPHGAIPSPRTLLLALLLATSHS